MISQSDQSQCVAATEETTVAPVPPRYWWLKRIALASAFLLAALVGLRLWWGWEANRRLQAEIDRIIAAGEPIYPEDFDPKEAIPDEQNAARLLVEANEAVNLTSEQQGLLEEVVGNSKEQVEEVRGIVEGNAEALTLVRRARGLPTTDWDLRIRTPAIETSLPALSGHRQLAKLMYLASWHRHVVGNDNEAIETVRDGLAQSRSISQFQTLIPQLVSWASAGFAIRALEHILPSLDITAKNKETSQGEGAASQVQIRNLIAELLDERQMREGMRRAMLAERMMQVDIHNELMRGKTTMSALIGWQGPPPVQLPDVVWRYALAPAITLSATDVLRHTTLLVEAADSPSYSGSAAEGGPWETQVGLRFLRHPFRGYLTGAFDWTFELYFRLLSRRRLAATALAIRLYEIDHGRRPELLSELVPVYLPRVPEDPFTENGQTLRYFPDTTHPLVYSIGVDREDDGGRSDRQRRDGDITFFLDGWRPEDESDGAPRTSTQASEDDVDIDDEEGEGDEDDTGEEEP